MWESVLEYIQNGEVIACVRMRIFNHSMLVSKAMRGAAPSAGNEEVVLFNVIRKECVISSNTVIIDFVRKDCALNSSAAASQ
jgi:hypothetical protein